MPIVSPSASIFSGLDLGEMPGSAYELTLFDLEEFSIVREETIASWRASNTRAIYEVGQRLIGSDLVQFGIPDGPGFEAAAKIVSAQDAAMAVFQEFRNLIGPRAREVAEQAIREIVAETLEALGSVIDTIEWIPAYGWLVEAVWDVAMGIRNLIQLVKRQNASPQILHERDTYNPDEDVHNALLVNNAVLDGVDLNWAFRPPSLGAPHAGASRFVSQDLLPRGSGWIRIQGNNLRSGGLGFCPWTTTIHQKIELAPQGRSVEDTGRFLVTTRGNCNILRGLLSGTDPILFSVDAERIKKEWAQYLFDLRVFLLELDVSAEAKAHIIRWLGQNPTGPQFDWFGPAATFDRKKGFENFGIKNSAPVRFWRTVEEHQRRVLDTPTVAYLSSEMPAVANGPLAAAFETNRQLLLEDPARCKIDLGNVRDPLYLARLESATEGPGCLAIGGITSRPGEGRFVGPVRPLPPPRPPGGGPGTPGGAAGVVAAIVGVGAAGWGLGRWRGMW